MTTDAYDPTQRKRSGLSTRACLPPTSGRGVIGSLIWMCVAGAAVFGQASAISATLSNPSVVTGEQLLRNFMGPPRENDDPFLKGADVIKHQTARGYINGVRDASEGVQWCFTGTLWKELNDDVASALKKLTPAQLKGPAAPLVIKVLHERFPCASVRNSP
ncbi:Rap1a/Tai family immunity protein [Massilia genomosp. 1]|uniref:Rap1a immunity protein domain-containing protein n=1 Tax=Massilia genomosp. 1 TaxID=2609280 RepID=A0ABX0N2Z8_9BURK|nr:Rap1a/Tai family immunity protein [Massilia genomosp. 1]NHZ66425.1 hypothetical protein [Massilia genomosp. 1]